MNNPWIKSCEVILPVYQYESDSRKSFMPGIFDKKNYHVAFTSGWEQLSYLFRVGDGIGKIPDLVKSGNIDIVIS